MDTAKKVVAASRAIQGRNSQRTEWRLFQLVAATLAITGAYFAKDILVPIALAVFLSFILAPVCDWIERWRVPRVASVLLAACLAAGVILSIVAVGYFQFREVGDEIPVYKESLLQRARALKGATGSGVGSLTAAFDEFGKAFAEGEAAPSGEAGAGVSNGEAEGGAAVTVNANGASGTGGVEVDGTSGASGSDMPIVSADGFGDPSSPDARAVPVQIVGVRESMVNRIRGYLGPALEPLGTAGIVIVLALFILLSRENLRDRIVVLLGSSNLHSTTAAVRDAGDRVGKYLRMTLLINSCYAGVIAIGCMLFGLPGAIVLGLLAGALRFLPYVGGWLASAAPVMLALAVHDGWGAPVGVAAMFILSELFINTVIEPWLYGSSIGVTSIGIIVAAVFWTWLWGPIGLFLAMPLTVCIVVAGAHVPSLRFLTVLFGEEEPMPPHERIYQRLLADDYDEAAEVAVEASKGKSLAETYDALLLPALAAAERDQHGGVLNESQQRSVFDGLDDLVEELREHFAKTLAADKNATPTADGERALACKDVDLGEGSKPFRALIVPAADRADEVGADLLKAVMDGPCSTIDLNEKRLLTVEAVEQIEREDYDVVVISIVPPAGTKHARYLCRRLRASRPSMPVIVALLQGEGLVSTRKLFEKEGADAVLFRAADAAERFDQIVRRLSHVDRDAAAKQAVEQAAERDRRKEEEVARESDAAPLEKADV